MTSRARASCLLVLLCCLVTAPAAADREAAQELFRSGRSAYKRGDYIAAAHSFEQAYEQDRTAEALYNAALSWHAAGRHARAATHYERALAAGGLDPKLEPEARRLLTELEPKVGVVTVDGPAGEASIEGALSAAVPARFYVDPGSHEVRLRRPDGSESTQTVVVSAGGVARVSFAAPPVAKPRPKPAPPAAPRPQPDKRTDDGSVRPLLGWGAIGLGVAAAGAAIYLGTQAVEARDEWVESNLEDLDAHDRAVRLRTWTNIAWGGALVFGATGAVLLLSGGNDQPSVALGVQPGSASASYRARF
jgi:tetratricopeptide (TPR) repeat protein